MEINPSGFILASNNQFVGFVNVVIGGFGLSASNQAKQNAEKERDNLFPLF